jgi:hypothetical protein
MFLADITVTPYMYKMPIGPPIEFEYIYNIHVNMR